MEQDNGRMRRRDHRFLNGFFLVIVGILLLGQKLNAGIPDWFLSWPMFAIGIGLLMGFHNGFRSFFWVIPVLWGGFALVDQQMPGLNLHKYSAPVGIIMLGLYLILRKESHIHARRPWRSQWQGTYQDTAIGAEGGEFMDSSSFLGGTKKVILSKNFKGGDITNIFGGAEIDLSQADIQGTVVIDITQVFGGTKLIVPSHWNLRLDITPVFGGLEDKRKFITSVDMNKTLVLSGNTIFGGIEINSYS